MSHPEKESPDALFEVIRFEMDRPPRGLDRLTWLRELVQTSSIDYHGYAAAHLREWIKDVRLGRIELPGMSTETENKKTIYEHITEGGALDPD